MRRRGVVLSVVLVAALGATLWRWPHAAKAKVEETPFPTAAVARTSFDVTLRVPGVLEAAKAEPVMATTSGATVAWMVEEGTAVKPGDVVVRLNTTDMAKQLTDQEQQDIQAATRERTGGEDAQRRVQTAKVGLDKAKSDLTLTQSQGRASVERETAQLKFTEKELEVAQAEYDRKARLAEEHLLALTQLESARDQLRSQKFQLEQATRTLEKTVREGQLNEQMKNLGLHKAQLELAGAESALEQTKVENARSQSDRLSKLTDARRQLAEAEMKSHSAGLVLVAETWDMGERKMRAGDKVWDGMKVASVIDPSNMLVTCDIGEADISRVRLGQVGVVKVEALGRAPLRGKVSAVDNVSRERSVWSGGTAKRVFSVKLQIVNREARLRPGMGATVEIVVEQAKQELSVPAETVFSLGGKQVVYRQKGQAFEAVPVTVKRRGEMRASLEGRLREGDRLALRRPPSERLAGTKERKP